MYRCNICGGKLIMQQSQNAVCTNCGMEYDISALRSMKPCINEFSVPEKPRSSFLDNEEFLNRQNNQIQKGDKQALILYLDRLRALESIAYNSQIEKQKC